MSYHSRDLTIDEALADPVIGAAMRADGVDPRQLERMLRCAARTLHLRSGADGTSHHPAIGAVLRSGSAGVPAW